MEQVILSRAPSSDKGTFGVLLHDGVPLCVTCERPWADNRHETSCIPLGLYRCLPYASPTKGLVWLLQGVTGRSMIEIHAANKPSQLRGCIAPGRQFAVFDGECGVTASKDTLKYLQETLPDQFDLIIIQPS